MFEISVIVPCYNAELYLDRCLNSIVTQDIGLECLQVICVDDASTDSTWQLLQKWEAKYPENFICIQLEHNSRQGAARNIAMQYVSAPYVSFIDADDWVDPDYYRIMYIPAKELDCDVICCSYKRDSSIEAITLEDRKTGKSSRFLLVDTDEKRKVLLHCRSIDGVCTCKLIKTDLLLFNHIYFLEHLAYEDIFWNALLNLYVTKIFIIEEEMYHYFINNNSTVIKKNELYHADAITVCLQIWSEWVSRDFMKRFQSELEYYFLYDFYFAFLRVTVLSFTPPSYSLFQLMRQLVIERIPDYRTNPYIDEHFDDFNKLLFQPLLTPINREEYNLLAKNARIYWAIHSKRTQK